MSPTTNTGSKAQQMYAEAKAESDQVSKDLDDRVAEWVVRNALTHAPDQSFWREYIVNVLFVSVILGSVGLVYWLLG
ncbi:MAG TPA: hypothetical protein VMW36_03505 [Patescibacteria group bacterium]|nr:hypothetical protein [Patescibacteria group bacterium]